MRNSADFDAALPPATRPSRPEAALRCHNCHSAGGADVAPASAARKQLVSLRIQLNEMKVRFALVARGIASAPPLEDQQAGDDAEQEPRHDAAEMAAYLVRFSGEVPTRELAVYEAYYLRRLSKQETSAALGISVNTVGTLLLRLRTRARTTAGR